MPFERIDGRAPDELRPVRLTRSYSRHAEGSCLIEVGHTVVLCTASVEEKVPGFLRGSGKGWVTAEYGMLPRSTVDRKDREAARGRQEGRTLEIQRLIGRALRAVTDLYALGERSIIIDADVLQADGGTRTAAITGGYVALAEALAHIRDHTKAFTKIPLNDFVAAISVGVIQQQLLLDLCYKEDSEASVDMNVVMTGRGYLVEVQGTAEGCPFTRNRLTEMLDVASNGIAQLIEAQRQILEGII